MCGRTFRTERIDCFDQRRRCQALLGTQLVAWSRCVNELLNLLRRPLHSGSPQAFELHADETDHPRSRNRFCMQPAQRRHRKVKFHDSWLPYVVSHMLRTGCDKYDGKLETLKPSFKSFYSRLCSCRISFLSNLQPSPSYRAIRIRSKRPKIKRFHNFGCVYCFFTVDENRKLLTTNPSLRGAFNK